MMALFERVSQSENAIKSSIEKACLALKRSIKNLYDFFKIAYKIFIIRKFSINLPQNRRKLKREVASHDRL